MAKQEKRSQLPKVSQEAVLAVLKGKILTRDEICLALDIPVVDITQQVAKEYGQLLDILTWLRSVAQNRAGEVIQEPLIVLAPPVRDSNEWRYYCIADEEKLIEQGKLGASRRNSSLKALAIDEGLIKEPQQRHRITHGTRS